MLSHFQSIKTTSFSGLGIRGKDTGIKAHNSSSKMVPWREDRRWHGVSTKSLCKFLEIYHSLLSTIPELRRLRRTTVQGWLDYIIVPYLKQDKIATRVIVTLQNNDSQSYKFIFIIFRYSSPKAYKSSLNFSIKKKSVSEVQSIVSMTGSMAGYRLLWC